ncbi:hypothetical protein [Caballeronia sp. GAFFF1]|uniref:hypothetical protein n=1 Tax=Caballeronia sp. GAFFF1 TaxID=2921779 RepID=UPI002028EFBD|nr:hypothetical protein [Caballeronia sp. GAFFF1]
MRSSTRKSALRRPMLRSTSRRSKRLRTDFEARSVPCHGVRQRGKSVSIGYNLTFLRSRRSTMEAERLNAIESLLADLRRRAGELRGYL